MKYLRNHAALIAISMLLVAGASSCASSSSEIASKDSSGFFAEPVDFIGVSFKPGHPSQGEILTAALSGTSDLEALESDLMVLKKMPTNIPLRVVGSTAAKECSGDACSELSLRRAKSVHDWLLSRGVPESRLSSPYGYGSERPIGDNETEDGRARNRRAYVSYEDAP